MKKSIKLFVAFMVMFIFMTGNSTSTNAAPSSVYDFIDYRTAPWWSDVVQWGFEQKIVTGYQDTYGNWRLGPDNNVTEVQFLTMVLRQMDNIDLSSYQKSGQWWGYPTYKVAEIYDIPETNPSLLDTTEANSPIRRGLAARIVAKVLTGQTMNEKDAVFWLYDNELAKGRGSNQTYEGYEPNGTLTRAEAITFIKRLNDYNYNELVDQDTASDEVPRVISIE